MKPITAVNDNCRRLAGIVVPDLVPRPTQPLFMTTRTVLSHKLVERGIAWQQKERLCRRWAWCLASQAVRAWILPGQGTFISKLLIILESYFRGFGDFVVIHVVFWCSLYWQHRLRSCYLHIIWGLITEQRRIRFIINAAVLVLIKLFLNVVRMRRLCGIQNKEKNHFSNKI